MSSSETRLPLWFRATAILLFATLFAAFLFVRERRSAHAEALGEEPALAAAAALDHGVEGDYRVNGVPVRSRRLWVEGAEPSVLERIASDATLAGYRTERTSIAGRPTLLGLHPKSGILLTATVEEERGGRSLVRLAEQRLRSATNPRHLVPRDVAFLADARDVVVVTPIDSRWPLTTSYAVARPSAWTDRAVEARMHALGWKPIEGAGDATGEKSPRWLAKAGREASVVVRPTDAGRSLVVISIDNRRGDSER